MDAANTGGCLYRVSVRSDLVRGSRGYDSPGDSYGGGRQMKFFAVHGQRKVSWLVAVAAEEWPRRAARPTRHRVDTVHKGEPPLPQG